MALRSSLECVASGLLCHLLVHLEGKKYACFSGELVICVAGTRWGLVLFILLDSQ